jgi:hypothetical protein
LIDVPTALEIVSVSTSNQVDFSPLGGNGAMERRYFERFIERDDLPLDWLVVFYALYLNHVQSRVSDFKEMKERETFEEVFSIDPVRVLLKKTINTGDGVHVRKNRILR